ncbi:hypothetical protein SAMN05216428_101244 [Nitrosospira sp. Nsp11]|nr:hypothetical protein SAMN05216428_101244 [Nitrosospira sp. Nsp11]
MSISQAWILTGSTKVQMIQLFSFSEMREFVNYSDMNV